MAWQRPLSLSGLYGVTGKPSNPQRSQTQRRANTGIDTSKHPACARSKAGWLILSRNDRRRRLKRVVITFAATRLGLACLDIGRRHRPQRPMLIAITVGVHHPKVMLGMLI